MLLLFVIVNLGLPTILARMIDEGINPRDVDRLYFWGWVMFAIILLGIVGRIILSYAVGQLTTTMVRDMRNDLYAKLQEYSHHEYEQIGVSSLVTRLTSDAFVLMQFADSMLKMGVITPLMMVSSVLLILTTSPSLAWIVAVSVPFLAVVVWYVAVKTRPLSEKQQKTLDHLNQFARENLTGLRVIRAFGQERREIENFQVLNQVYTAIQMKTGYWSSLLTPLTYLIVNGTLLVIIWNGYISIQGGLLSQGALIALITLVIALVTLVVTLVIGIIIATLRLISLFLFFLDNLSFFRFLGVSATMSFGSRAQNTLHQLVCLRIRAQGLSHCPPRSKDQIERDANNWP